MLKAVEAGETILITRRVHAVASLAPVRRAPAPVDIAWLRDATSRMEYSPMSAAGVVREMRDARY